MAVTESANLLRAEEHGSTTRVLRSPAKYVQGYAELQRLHEHLADLGNHLFILASPSGRARMQPAIEKGLAGHIEYEFGLLEGECSQKEIDKLLAQMQGKGFTVVAGIGGGKILDAAKALAYYTNLPLAILPTSAATDAPCSTLSVLYKDDGEFDRYLFLRQSPQLVLVDSQVIVNAPVRLFVAGMGDALATGFEARAVAQSGKNNQVKGKPTVAGGLLAQACYTTLLQDGLAAKLAVQKKCCTKAVENIIEVNTYLSGVGFESGGLGAAHAIQKGFTTLPQLHDVYHGEKVAFSTLTQLVMEKAPRQELEEVMGFCTAVGLPITFAELGIPDVTMEELQKVADFTCRPGMTVHNMPMAISARGVCHALAAADALGTDYKNRHAL